MRHRISALLASPSLRRRLVLALGSLALASIALAAALAYLMVGVAEAFAQVRADEHASEQGLMLGVAVREQYMHEAHTLIEGTRAHLAHHHEWVEQVAHSSRELSPRVPPSERWRLERIAAASLAIDRLFRTALVPAMERGDTETLTRRHREVDALVSRTARDADAVAAALDRRMRSAHERAERATDTALIVAAAGGLLVVLLAAFHGVRLRTRAIRPLADLVEATRQIARGEVPAPAERGDLEVRAVREALVLLSAELRERERRLVATERMAVVGQLAAGVAHEVNNPIGVIRGYLRTMIPDATDDEQRRELLILDEEAAACQRIAEDLLAYARSGELKLAETAVGPLVADTVERLGASGAIGDVSVRATIAPAALRADAQRMRQVIENLLRNAAHVSEPGCEVEIVGAPMGDDSYRLAVLDRGPGVAELDRERIFDPFYTARPGGSGLGLAVCSAVVRAHGGSIGVRNRDGGGAVFEIVVPLAT